MLRLCKTLIRHILYKKSTVDVNVLSSHLVDTYSWIHHGCPYRTCYLLPALCHLECTANGGISNAYSFMMPKTKRKSKHKKSKHSRRHKKAKYCVPEIIELSSSSSDNESDLVVVFDLKQERLRVASENIVNVPDSDNEDVTCEKVTQTQVDLVSDTESVSNQETVSKEKDTVTTNMGNTVGEGIVWTNVQNVVPANAGHGQNQNDPANYTYGQSYASGNFYARNMSTGLYMSPYMSPYMQTQANVSAANMSAYMQTQANVSAANMSAYMQTQVNVSAANVYPSSNAQTAIHTFAEATSASWSSTLCGDQTSENIWNVVEQQKGKLRKKRRWERTVSRMSLTDGGLAAASQLFFTVMSYNVLAQDLIHQHGYLYQAHNPQALNWELRSKILMDDIKEANAQVLCLQEVQENLLETFYKQLNEMGYKGIYKRRTGNNVDGVAIYYKTDVFELVDYTTVEYFQPNVDRLNRDNVGLVAKLAFKVKPNKHLVVATTHLLFNPRRHDVKLSQIQVLLAEVERFAFDSFRHGKSYYWPVIITGDMNFLPYTGVYRLLTEGTFRYEGRCSKTLEKHSYYGSVLEKRLLPDSLQITDTCQHWGILCNRMVQKMDHKEEIKLLKIHNSDHLKLQNSSNENEAELQKKDAELEDWDAELEKRDAELQKKDAELEKRDVELGTQNVKNKNPESSECFEQLSFGTGKLSHPFRFRSVYKHGNRNGTKREVTTNQRDWVTVDYIFYSVGRNKEDDDKAEDELKLVARYKLLTADEAELFGPIPNFASPSDHYPLLASFLVKT